MCILILILDLHLDPDLRSSAVSRRRRPQPPSGPVHPRTRPWSLARSIHALGAAAVATRGAPADRRDPLAHPEPPTRRPCRRCALSAGGLVPAGTDRAGQGPAASSAPRPLQHCRDRRALLRGASATLEEVGGRRVASRPRLCGRGSHGGARVCGTRQKLLGWSRLGFGPCVHGGTRDAKR